MPSHMSRINYGRDIQNPARSILSSQFPKNSTGEVEFSFDGVAKPGGRLTSMVGATREPLNESSNQRRTSVKNQHGPDVITPLTGHLIPISTSNSTNGPIG